MCRRKRVLLSIVIILAVFSLFIPGIVRGSVPEVKTTSLQSIDYANCVIANGEIEQLNKQCIKSQYPAVISQVFIKVGDKVTKGQIVARIDKEMTAAKLSATGEYAAMAGASSDALSSYQGIIDKLPTNITSTVEGIVESVNVTSGGYIEQDGIIASMVSGDNLFVKVKVPENKISQVKVGQKVDISGSGFVDGKYYGYVSTISPSAKRTYIGTSQETVVEVMVTIENCDASIKSGYSARVSIETQQPEKKLIIPYTAITQDEDGNEFVYIVSGGYTKKCHINTGLELSDGVEVKSGIAENDIVVADPLSVKGEGDLVRIIE